MAITTTLQTKFTLQKVFVIIVSLVMGLWGIYDHEVKIPNQARAYERGQVCLKTKNALEADPTSPATGAKLIEAKDAVGEQLDKMLDLDRTRKPTPEEANRAIESIRARNEQDWLAVLLIFQQALAEARTRTASTTPSDEFKIAYDVARKGVDDTADVSPPGRFDQATQWMFILCLPFVPYFAWSLYRTRKRVYTLDDDGALHAPEGTWTKDQIADIDMSRWMAKSIAHVEAADGTRVKLDDYVHRNTHLIVGALASERYPDEWDPEARLVKRAAADPADEATADEDAGESDPGDATATRETPAEV